MDDGSNWTKDKSVQKWLPELVLNNINALNE